MRHRSLTSTALAAGLLLLPSTGRTAADDPVPIPGGGPGFHAFAPGPRSLGLKGLHVEPSTITDFSGQVALAYLAGRATDGEGRHYRMISDMRIFRGDYVASDRVQRRGAFAFV